MSRKLYRQGDVLIQEADALPPRATPRPDGVLAEGELTGHRHRVADPELAELVVSGGEMYLVVTGERARVVHEEHDPIELPRGTYRVWRQREYAPRRVHGVQD